MSPVRLTRKLVPALLVRNLDVTLEFYQRLGFQVTGRHPESVQALAEEWRGQVSFAWGPEVMEYGMLEFGVQDPDGYYLAFTEPA